MTLQLRSSSQVARGNKLKESPNQRRQRLEAERRRQAAERRRRQSLIGTAVVIAVVLVAVIVGIVVSNSGSKSAAIQSPKNAGPGHSVLVGKGSAPVTVDFYEDFQCPNCQQLEAATGSTINQLIDSGKIKARYHMLNFLDENSANGKFSTKAANLALCADNSGKFKPVHDAIYAHQPAEGSGGMSEAQLLQLAKNAGAGDLKACFDKQPYTGFVNAALTDASKKFGQVSTPTVLVNDKPISDLSPQGFTAAVTVAAKS
jgi:protein-disulfide isomerase